MIIPKQTANFDKEKQANTIIQALNSINYPRVIIKMLVYAYRTTFPGILASDILLGGAPLWMKLGTQALRDPSGQKKVFFRLIEKLLLGRAFLSPMVASDYYHFIDDPLNLSHRSWTHPWTGESQNTSFPELYRQAETIYLKRLRQFDHLSQGHCEKNEWDAFLKEYGNRSFLSGLTCCEGWNKFSKVIRENADVYYDKR